MPVKLPQSPSPILDGQSHAAFTSPARRQCMRKSLPHRPCRICFALPSNDQSLLQSSLSLHSLVNCTTKRSALCFYREGCCVSAERGTLGGNKRAERVRAVDPRLTPQRVFFLSFGLHNGASRRTLLPEERPLMVARLEHCL